MFLVGTLCIISVAVFRMTPFLVKAFLLLFLCSFFVIFVMITHPTLFDCFDENNEYGLVIARYVSQFLHRTTQGDCNRNVTRYVGTFSFLLPKCQSSISDVS